MRWWPSHPATASRVALIATLLLSVPSLSHGATPQQVDDAIAKGTKYIYSRFKGDNWELVPGRNPAASLSDIRNGQWGALTSVATYALLAAGESPQEPRIEKAITFLKGADIVGTYALGMRTQVWVNVPRSDDIRAALAKDAKMLAAAQKIGGPNIGLYDYTNTGPTGTKMSLNASQYGALGMWACSSEPNARIPDNYWVDTDAGWRREQGTDGSWADIAKPGTVVKDSKGKETTVTGTPTMTAAGVATLFIDQEFLNPTRWLECSGNVVNPNVDLGLKWLGDHFRTVFKGSQAFYGLYGMERIGAASGYKYFGAIDWYKEGTDWVLAGQRSDGSFPGEGRGIAPENALLNSCLAVIFLSRGRAPIMMNKLDYSTEGKVAAWNERPHDAFNIVRWVGRETENTLNWQIVTLNSPVDDWHDAPILYISGNDVMNLADADKAKLKTFIQQGGLILGNADCGKKEFSDGFLALGAELFKDYEFKPLSPDGAILHNEQFLASKWRRQPTLLGMDNGARQLMILIPDADASKAWQYQITGGKEELFQMAANIFLYAVDKTNLSEKGEAYIVEPDPKVKSTATIQVARLKYEGNWDPEPGGWRHLNAVMHNGDSLDVTTEEVDPATPDALAGKKIAHLTGTGVVKLSDKAKAAIQKFTIDGGTLVIDAAGGNGRFTQSIEDLLKSIFGDDADQLKNPLPSDSPLYQTGGKLGEVAYRLFARSTISDPKAAHLRAIIKNGHLVCVYSREDLSVGLVGQPVDGIIGYEPATATALMRKILLMASGATPVAPPIPPPPPKRTSKPKRTTTTRPTTKPTTRLTTTPTTKPAPPTTANKPQLMAQ